MLGECPPERLCDFETPDVCRYQNDPRVDLEWKRITGEASSFQIPDHTYQSLEGHFMSVEKLQQSKNGIK